MRLGIMAHRLTVEVSIIVSKVLTRYNAFKVAVMHYASQAKRRNRTKHTGLKLFYEEPLSLRYTKVMDAEMKSAEPNTCITS